MQEQVADAIARDAGILEAFGMQVTRVDSGSCDIECVVPANLVNAGGFAHGSIIYSIMDTACAYALRSAGVSGVTISGNVNYTRGGRAGSRMRGSVSVVSQGKRVASLRGEVHVLEGEDWRLAGHGSFLFQLRDV